MRRGAARQPCVTGNTRGSQAHHTSRVQADGSLRVSSTSPVTELVSGLSGDNMVLVLVPVRSGKSVPRPERASVCAARAGTDKVNELHHERRAAEGESSGVEAGRPRADKHRNYTHTHTRVKVSSAEKVEAL